MDGSFKTNVQVATQFGDWIRAEWNVSYWRRPSKEQQHSSEDESREVKMAAALAGGLPDGPPQSNLRHDRKVREERHYQHLVL